MASRLSRLTCFAIPKSASLTRPLGSTSMLAPLMSLQIIDSTHKSKSKNRCHLLNVQPKRLNKKNSTCGPYSWHANKLSLKVSEGCSCVLLVHQAVHILVEVYVWIHQKHIPNICKVYLQPNFGQT